MTSEHSKGKKAPYKNSIALFEALNNKLADLILFDEFGREICDTH
jgi:hypothetical protein